MLVVVVVCVSGFAFLLPMHGRLPSLVIGEAQGLYWFSTPFSFQFLFSAGFLFFALRYPPQLLRSDAVLAIRYELANSQEHVPKIFRVRMNLHSINCGDSCSQCATGFRSWGSKEHDMGDGVEWIGMAYWVQHEEKGVMGQLKAWQRVGSDFCFERVDFFFV